MGTMKECHGAFEALTAGICEEILGQSHLVESLLVTLLAGGHLLVEGAPGLAKTKAIKVLAGLIEGDYHRIQFTPDLLPGDLTGTEIFRPQTGEFEFQKGPLFHNILLADEINRAPAKVQSALLESMAEKQITVGMRTYELPEVFMVMATQNPIEQEGTYPLPEAQLDRFLMKVNVGYPDASVEKKILALDREASKLALGHDTVKKPVRVTQQHILTARQAVLDQHISPQLEEYIVHLIVATRKPEQYHPSLAGKVRFGASPRGTLSLASAARARSWLSGREYVAPEDIHQTIYDVLRHRILLSYAAEAEGLTVDDVVKQILQAVAVP